MLGAYRIFAVAGRVEEAEMCQAQHLQAVHDQLSPVRASPCQALQCVSNADVRGLH